MPIYEYKCLKNNHSFDVLLTHGETPPQQCPTCASPVEKQMSASAFHLKGSGWYSTDYKKCSPAKASSSDTTPAATTESGSSCATDSCGCK